MREWFIRHGVKISAVLLAIFFLGLALGSVGFTKLAVLLVIACGAVALVCKEMFPLTFPPRK